MDGSIMADADLDGEVDDGDVGVVELVEHVRLAEIEALELDVVHVVRTSRSAAREPNLQIKRIISKLVISTQ